jgi:endonuclease G
MLHKFRPFIAGFLATLWVAVCSLMPSNTAAAHDGGELHTFHCLHGCPIGAASIDDIVVREIYTLASNDLTKMADWVAYRVTPDSIGRSGERKWAADPWLALDETLEPQDYEGGPAALGIDRGHQAPLAGQSGTPFAAATNLLSNITRQGAALVLSVQCEPLSTRCTWVFEDGSLARDDLPLSQGG